MLHTLARTAAQAPLRAPRASATSPLVRRRLISHSAPSLARSTRERRPVQQPQRDTTPEPSFPPGSAGGKIQTIPFQLAPDAALRVSETAAASAFGVQNVFRLLASRFLRRWFGFSLDNEIRRIAFTPLLVPVWKVDLSLKGKALVGDIEMQLNISALDSSLPGFRLPPLSDLTVAPPLASPPVPFSTSTHLTQFDQPVTLLPFTRHPLNLVHKLKSFPRKFSPPSENEEGDEEPGASLDPKAFDETLFAAYPMYLPLYLGEFAHEGAARGEDGEEKRVTTAAFATVDGPAFAVYPQFIEPRQWLPPSESVSLGITGRPLLSPSSAPPAPAEVASLQPRLLKALTEFKDEAEEGSFDLLDPVEGDAEELVRTSERAMAFGEWAEVNRAYVEAQGELDAAQAMLEQVEALPEAARGLLLSARGPRLSSRQDLLGDMRGKVDAARDKVDEVRPEWMARGEGGARGGGEEREGGR
ncbi:hypothetical protein DMC30DRAFT_447514 [Rhodotorula diobovata]|uniref:Uncharacterized protein n=1 Tax=Rhodotorula diobovata TaxID=5288 RepID=A0A5C5FSN9_9BASI|nr:hypothetical protein DMC30DRAFT_447514 [Rhodotorula diobovata]